MQPPPDAADVVEPLGPPSQHCTPTTAQNAAGFPGGVKASGRADAPPPPRWLWHHAERLILRLALVGFRLLGAGNPLGKFTAYLPVSLSALPAAFLLPACSPCPPPPPVLHTGLPRPGQGGLW